MADNFLITGYWGEPHVTAENDRGINAAIFGGGRKVLPVGEQFRAEYIGNNTIRMYDGKLIDGGAVAGIPAGEFVDLYVPETGQGMYRNDLIIFRYSKDASTMIESGTFEVLPGTESTTTPADPTLTQEDILSGSATGDMMVLWRVSVSGATISAPVQLFEVFEGGSALTKEDVEAVLTGNITSHTHSTYMPKSGGTFTGKAVAQNNADYTTKQLRNVFLVASGSTLPTGANGDICLVYTP